MLREDVAPLERDRELAMIRERLVAARGGSGGMLMVEGPAR
jgi:hypothetical protein